MPRARYGRDRGRERALWHIRAAGVFSTEVDGTDGIVKEVFFRLSGATFEAFLKEYARRHGTQSANYARDTRDKWRRGLVNMSGAVAQRLYDLVPPFMLESERARIVEILWRRYAPKSARYLYVGSDASEDDVLDVSNTHFRALLTLGNLPLYLASRFEWLTQNDAIKTRRLLMNYVEPQRDTAIAVARPKISAMVAAMRGTARYKPDALSHTIVVGDAALTLKADPLRSGLLLTESAVARIKPPSRFRFGGVALVAAVLVGLVLLARAGTTSSYVSGGSYGDGYSGSVGSGGGGGYRGTAGGGGAGGSGVGGSGEAASGSASSGEQSDRNGPGSAAEQPAAAGAIQSANASVSTNTGPSVEGSKSNGVDSATSPRLAGGGSPVLANGSSVRTAPDGADHVASAAKVATVRHPMHAPRSVILGVTTGRASRAAATARTPSPAARAQGEGCSQNRIAHVNDGGTMIDLDDGRLVSVSAGGLMRYDAQRWQTGMALVACVALDRNSVDAVSLADADGYTKVQGAVLGLTAPHPVSCGPATLRSMDQGGSLLQTTDGRVYRVSANGLMRYDAARWSTGDPVVVCTARIDDDLVSAGLRNEAHSESVEARVSTTLPPSSVKCTTRTIVAVNNSGANIELSDHALYSISTAGLMRYDVARWTTGETVRACMSHVGARVVASIENSSRYEKVQATRE